MKPKKPGPLPKPITLKGEGPSASELTLTDREAPEVQKPLGEEVDDGEWVDMKEMRRLVAEPGFFVQKKRPRPANMRGAFEYVQEEGRQLGREEAAQIADLVARRRAIAGDEAGAGAAQDIARFIRADESMGEG